MSDCIAQRCLKAFATSFFGRVNGLKDTQADGMKLYVTSLKELNGCLQRPDQSAPSETILSIVILAVCEVSTTTISACPKKTTDFL
jgi:predicted enzyme related to lactoylglutathione lyase